jgi:hypothetical protein
MASELGLHRRKSGRKSRSHVRFNSVFSKYSAMNMSRRFLACITAFIRVYARFFAVFAGSLKQKLPHSSFSILEMLVLLFLSESTLDKIEPLSNSNIICSKSNRIFDFSVKLMCSPNGQLASNAEFSSTYGILANDSAILLTCAACRGNVISINFP